MDDDRRSRCPACAAPLGLRGSAPWAGPDKRGRTYFECPSCHLLFIDPAFIVDEPSQRARYLLHRNALGDPGYRSVLSAFLDFALSGRVAAPARVLDYGSGPEPALAGLLAERGYEVSSWDPFFMPARAGIRGPYGAVLLHEVLEHCEFPLAALRDAASLVARGGVVASSTLFRPSDPETFMRWWYREDVTHVSFMDSRCLAVLARLAGLEPIADDGRSLSVFRKPDD